MGAQRDLLRRLIAKSRVVPQDITIATVDALQGAERDLIFFSATRSNSSGAVGFLADARRMNVALTRARYGVIVFADPETLGRDPHWAAWLAWVRSSESAP